MQYQAFDYLVCLHHRLSPQSELAQLSWIILSTRMFTLSDLVVSHLVPMAPPFQVNSFQHIIMCLHQTISSIQKDLRSVTLVTFHKDLLETILPNEAQVRGIVLPSAFNNYIPLVDSFKVNNLTLAEFADDLGEKVQMFQHQTVLLSRCCVNLLKRNHRFDKLVYVDRLGRNNNTWGVVQVPHMPGQGTVQSFIMNGLGGERSGGGVMGEIDTRDRDYKYYKLRGLPFKVVNQDILNFLEISSLIEGDIQYEFRHNKFSGTAWVRVEAQYADSIESKNEKNLNNRYIEISKASKVDFIKCRSQNQETRQKLHERKDSRNTRQQRNRSRSRSRSHKKRRRRSSSSDKSCRYSLDELNDMGIVKMRGLPYEATNSQIINFFAKFKPIQHSLKVGRNNQGRKSGQAVILFSTRKEAKEALQLYGQKIGSRYIQLITIRSDQYKRFKS